MSVAADCRTYLLADGAIAGAVGARIYPGNLPQHGTLPAIAYAVISRGHQNHLGGIAAAGPCRLQWDCYAATQLAADALAELVVARFKTLAAAGPTTIGAGTAVCDCEVHGPISDTEAPGDGSDEWEYRSIVDSVLMLG